jgi:hypothetical protein
LQITKWVHSTRSCKWQSLPVLVHGRWFSAGTPSSSTTKTGRHDIAEILLKVALNTEKKIIYLNKTYLILFCLDVTTISNCLSNRDVSTCWKWIDLAYIYNFMFLLPFDSDKGSTLSDIYRVFLHLLLNIYMLPEEVTMNR